MATMVTPVSLTTRPAGYNLAPETGSPLSSSSMQLRKLPPGFMRLQWRMHQPKPVKGVSQFRRSVVSVAAISTSPAPAPVPGKSLISTTRRHTKWAISLCDHLEKKVMQWAGVDTASEREACYLLLENYAPVSEMAPTSDLAITGTIPACMNGEFLRVGPNPKFEPVGGYHW